MRRPRFFARGLVVLSLLAGACSTADEDASFETADEIIASIDQPITRALSSDDCIRTVVIDEYGFETETAVCVPGEVENGTEGDDTLDTDTLDSDTLDSDTLDSDILDSPDDPIDVDALLADGSDLPLTLLATLIGDVPDDDIRRSLGALSLLLDELDASCGVDPEAWVGGAETAAAEIEAIAVSIEAVKTGESSGAMADYTGTSTARLLARALLERTVLLTGCSDTETLVPADSTLLRLNVATATVATAMEHLRRLLRDSLTDPFFFHSDELAHLRWMRSTTASVEFIVTGTSQATHGISPTQLGNASGRVVASVAIPGSVAEIQQHWLTTVLDLIDPTTIIWAIGPIDLVVSCGDDGREANFVEGAARRSASFERFGWLDEVPSVDRILGPIGNEVYLETNLGQETVARYASNERGEAVRLGSISEFAIDEQLKSFGPAYEQGVYCADRAVLIRSVVETLQAEGHEVVLIGMPASPDLTPFYPGGSEGLADVMERFRVEVAEPTGAPFIDLTGAIQEPQFWSDLVHPVTEGSVAFTDILAAALAERGIW